MSSVAVGTGEGVARIGCSKCKWEWIARKAYPVQCPRCHAMLVYPEVAVKAGVKMLHPSLGRKAKERPG